MASTYSRRTLDFLLYEVFHAERLTSIEYFAKHGRENFNLVLDTAESIAAKYMRPAFRESDRVPPTLANGKVRVNPALSDYYKARARAGLFGPTLSVASGGQQLPSIVYAAADFIEGNAHNGFEMFANLANGAASLIDSFASPVVKAEYLPKILSGECTATMCMTEPQAGSSIGDIRTAAIPVKDGTFKIRGQKVFISGGDHDITENIIHLVLARMQGSVAGTKGLSLFLVPKLRSDGTPNDIQTVGIAHKMGQRSTPAVQLALGENDDCIGYLIGEANKGLPSMFYMMNMARLNTGLASAYIATHAYYVSLQYAKERKQGRRPSERDHGSQPVTIISHADVRKNAADAKNAHRRNIVPRFPVPLVQ